MVQLPLRIRRRPGQKTVVDAGGVGGSRADRPIPIHAEPALVKALARAFRCQKMLDEAEYASITKMAKAERPDCGCMRWLLPLTLLARICSKCSSMGLAGSILPCQA